MSCEKIKELAWAVLYVLTMAITAYYIFLLFVSSHVDGLKANIIYIPVIVICGSIGTYAGWQCWKSWGKP